MIGYVTVGTNDFDKAAAFYDALLAELGGARAMEMDGFIGWASESKGAMIGIIKPNDKNPATVGNGVMLALAADSKEKVKAVYDKAIELGATSEGEVGNRGDTFYAGYFRDLDGNKLNVFCMGDAAK
ncbi:MAG: glyoxalase [SAR86 cluster bacterium]|uniref:Glyoxalase n=1 Tax=SAR86 cluster bacterium TaxID=2030880 RepID=A0A2A4MNF0_9GAMM|nr:MAG: glyoxalase [SAR86 cluster bacterium]